MYFIVAFQFAAGSSWFFNLSNSDRFRPLLDSAEFEGKRAHPFGKVAAGYRLQVTGYRLQVTGCRLQVTGCRLQVTGCRLQVAGYGLRLGGSSSSGCFRHGAPAFWSAALRAAFGNEASFMAPPSVNGAATSRPRLLPH